MGSALMEEAREHLSYIILDDAMKRRALETQHWQHLRECYECTLRLATMLAVEADYEELRKKFPAA